MKGYSIAHKFTEKEKIKELFKIKKKPDFAIILYKAF